MNCLRVQLTMTVALALLPIATIVGASVKQGRVPSGIEVETQREAALQQHRGPDRVRQRSSTGTKAEAAGGRYTKAQADRGQNVYRKRCAACHGAAFVPDDFSPALKGAAFQWRWKDRTAYDLFEAIRTTMPMGEVGSLGPQATVDVVAYLLEVNGFPNGNLELAPDKDALQTLSLKR